jgi:hypothetical protein
MLIPKKGDGCSIGMEKNITGGSPTKRPKGPLKAKYKVILGARGSTMLWVHGPLTEPMRILASD